MQAERRCGPQHRSCSNHAGLTVRGQPRATQRLKMTETITGDIKVFQTPAAQTPNLESMWRELQDRADGSFFISWSWIGAWLAGLPSDLEVQLVRAENNGQIIGLALLVVGPLRRVRVSIGKVAHLHTTGHPEIDGITIEHNGFLLDRGSAPAAQLAMLDFLCDKRREWRSVCLPGLTHRQPIAAEALLPSVVLEVSERNANTVELQPVRDRSGDYLSLLSAGRRAHIRRSMRACAEWGPLALTQANDVDSAAAYFDRLLHLHGTRRASLRSKSAFDTPFARAFHRRLIDGGLPRGEVQLVRVRAGEHDVGYLYNFVHRGHVYFYQSGFDFGRVDHKFSPGLVTVALAIEHNARLGHHCFDFLAGDAQYKKTLATHSVPLSWVELHRDGTALRTENLIRAAGRRGREWLRSRF